MAIDLNKIKARLDKNFGNNSQNVWLRFDRPEVGKNLSYNLRILPEASGDPFWVRTLHYKLTRGGFLCPRVEFGEHCEACTFGFELWNEAKATGDKEAEKLAKDVFLPSERFYAVVVDREKESEGPKIWSFGRTVYQRLITLVENPEVGDFTDPDTGRDLTVTLSKTKGKIFHDIDVMPSMKVTPLHKNKKTAQEFLDNIPDVEAQFVRKTPDEVKQYLNEYLAQQNMDEEVAKYGSKKVEVDVVSNAFNELLNN